MGTNKSIQENNFKNQYEKLAKKYQNDLKIYSYDETKQLLEELGSKNLACVQNISDLNKQLQLTKTKHCQKGTIPLLVACGIVSGGMEACLFAFPKPEFILASSLVWIFSGICVLRAVEGEYSPILKRSLLSKIKANEKQFKNNKALQAIVSDILKTKEIEQER